MPQSRQLAAIMFTDIVGYTKLMQDSESAAIKIRNRHREVFDRCHENFHGQIIQYYGDGTLSIFDSSIEAVYCAIEIQRQLPKFVPLRIGIHFGEVLLSESDIIGDSVNIASRIESLGVAGNVLVSDGIKKNTKTHADIEYHLLGTFHFKNDAYARDIYAVQAHGLYIPATDELSGKLQKSANTGFESLAVLPFDNLTGDKNKDILVAGIHDNLITAISKISSLRVISKTSTLKYMVTDKSLVEIATELNVETIVEASVLKAQENIRLNIQLINVFPKEDHIWADVFDCPLNEINFLLNEITQTISEKIDLVLTPKESKNLSTSSPVNVEAYELYLSGMFYMEKLTADDLELAIQHLKKAIDIDPFFTPAYSGIPMVLIAQVQMGLIAPTTAMPQIYQYYQKALTIDPYSFESLYTKAFLHWSIEWNWEESEISFLKAIDLNPNHSLSRAFYGHLLMIRKKFDASVEQSEYALKIDPNNPLILALAAVVFYNHGQVQKSLELAEKSYEIDQNSILVQRILEMCYHHTKDYNRSIQMLKLILQPILKNLDELGSDFDQIEYKKAVVSIAKALEKLSDQQFVQPAWVAVLYIRAGLSDEAMKWLERGFQMHDQDLPYMFIYDDFEQLQNDRRFQGIIKKMNLPYVELSE